MVTSKLTAAELRQHVQDKTAKEGLDRFLSKSGDYGNDLFEFDIRAQAPDIMRKAKKIKAVLWDGRNLQHEGLVELAYDLIGHCYILIARWELERHDYDNEECEDCGEINFHCECP